MINLAYDPQDPSSWTRCFIEIGRISLAESSSAQQEQESTDLPNSVFDGFLSKELNGTGILVRRGGVGSGVVCGMVTATVVGGSVGGFVGEVVTSGVVVGTGVVVDGVVCSVVVVGAAVVVGGLVISGAGVGFCVVVVVVEII